MAKIVRLNKVLKELNISLDRAVEHLNTDGFEVEARPTTKLSDEEYKSLCNAFQTDRQRREASDEVGEEKKKELEAIREEQEKVRQAKLQKEEEERNKTIKAKAQKLETKVVGKIDLNPKPKVTPKPVQEKSPEPVKEEPKVVEEKTTESVEEKVVEKPKEVEKPKIVEKLRVSTKPKGIIVKGKIELEKPKKQVKEVEEVKEVEKPKEPEMLKTKYQKLAGPKITGKKLDLSKFEKPKKEKPKKDAKASNNDNKKRRRRIRKPGGFNRPNTGGAGQRRPAGKPRKKFVKEEPTEEDVKKQIQETLEKLQGKSKKQGVKHRRKKRDQHRELTEQELEIQEAESKVIKVTEFVTANELATMMDKSVTDVISACMMLGMMVTMNQRLDAETLTILADEFGYSLEFVGADVEEGIQEVEDAEEDLVPRSPIVTIMGHVDHGKTSLLDYIREANVIAGEAGGITQHIGAYSVKLKTGENVTFLDTPGHEAFTAMRARGAKVTDIVVIVVAADDAVMPQTKEAISHAQAAGVPILFAINKVDLPNSNPEKIKEQLSVMNLLVEDWGGKIQSQDLSAKTGLGVDDLLEKILLEAELLELKANPNKDAVGTVVEAQLDKGRGYVTTLLVEGGTLKVGDYILAGSFSGKVKAMFDERGNAVKQAGPATPVSILGLDGAPQAGDRFNVLEDEREAKQIANKRSQLQREQSVRTQRHITLDEIGRRIALGDFKELNIILKGDVDGSVEALSGSLQKLSTEAIQINILHKGVGAITESDVLLASASDAIIIGFNVRPAGAAKAIADKEEIDIRMYSIIYDAINDLKDAMEGMLSPDMVEEVTGNAEIREVYKISKVGNIAGCMVTSGKIFRKSSIRIIREGIVIHSGELDSLKRFKDDVKEVAKGYDCGLQIKGFNDIKVEDVIEFFHEVEVKRKLK
ncbi:MAG TPA: translation initiation factor IF-2 [Lutibacter sp.]|nr:translation initiation factor IF-2 [Lutibacter sp.]